MQYEEILKHLHSRANPENVQGMARYGIRPANPLGISMPELRALAKQIGKNHELALQLWTSGIHEARILACLVELPAAVTEAQMEDWVKDFDSWDVCDQCCGNLFDRTALAYQKAAEWSAREEEFVKRAGFALIAWLALHDKKAGDAPFLEFLPLIRRESVDPRNFVKKAVNWALRHIGKRNLRLNRAAIQTAREILEIDAKSAKWIAADALKELTSEKVQERVKRDA
ncbi:MAG: DNA alkylation repair protein [Calditrichaceae bacterium]|nr:DNA alkylation repair protein [Calditrichia bacterium]NUQ42720.1 DNA alkylation repair protein [Calditrichaceae bacterium]